jgi:alpha-tubulin suppressor-like RCC1 family protein
MNSSSRFQPLRRGRVNSPDEGRSRFRRSLPSVTFRHFPAKCLLSLLAILLLSGSAQAALVNVVETAVNDADGSTISAVSVNQFIEIGTTLTTSTAPTTYSSYSFTHWTFSGEPATIYRDPWGRAQNPVSLLVQVAATATAHYLPTTRDSDGDGVRDWYEIHHYGTLTNGAASDTDGDGISLLAEYTAGTSPLYANTVQEGNVAWVDSALVTCNLAGYPAYTMSSVPAGTVTQSGFAAPGTVLTVPDLAGNSNFGYWTLDGVRQQDAWGRSLSTFSFTMASVDREAVAYLFPGDTDADSVPDAYEQRHFGTLTNNGSSDTDGDGIPLLTEYTGNTSPLYGNTLQEGGVAWADSALVTCNLAGYATYTLRSVPAGTVNQTGFVAPGTVVTAPDLASNSNFAYWTLDGVRQQDAWGRSLSTFSFTMASVDREAVAYLFAGDSDGDGVPDAYEQRHFGTLSNNGSSDTDGDGIPLLTEYTGNTSPLYGNTLQEGGVAWADSVLVTADLQAEITVEQPLTFDVPDGGSRDFGTVAVGRPRSLTFTIGNAGGRDLTGLTYTMDGPDAAEFEVTTDPVAPVPHLGTTTFTVRFSPTSLGPKSATLHLASNDANENPFDLTVTGTSILEPIFTSASDIGFTSNGFSVGGATLGDITLDYPPSPGTTLTLVKNTGPGFILGEFGTLTHGQRVPLTYNGITYHFVANYYGGTGNDLVLQWANLMPVLWGRQEYDSRDFHLPFEAVTAGGSHTVALKSDGTVVAWGSSYDGRTAVPGGLTGVVAIDADVSHSLALKDDGTVVAWGDNSFGQTSVPPGLSGVVAITAGASHSVALKNDGTVVAWGENSDGETSVPVDLSGVVAIAAGGHSGISRQGYTVAVKNDGTVVAWGNNSYGQASVPAGLSGVIAIAAGGAHTVALKNDGTVVVWGDDSYGQTVVPAGLSEVVAIAAGSYHTLALKSDGTVVAWGATDSGQTAVPAGLGGVTAIAGGGAHSVALKNDGTLVAWGRNIEGQLLLPSDLNSVLSAATGNGHLVALKEDGTVFAWGDNTEGQTAVPAGLSGVVGVAAGADHSVALKSDGTVVAWGTNDGGESTVPPGLSGVAAIAAGESHTLALKGDGTVVAWGSDFSGSGKTVVPADLSGVVAVAAGSLHSVALKGDGTVVAWGSNSQPVPAGLSGVVAIAAGDTHTLALKSDGTVVAWGDNNYGQTMIPVGLSGVVAIAAQLHSVALKDDGTVVAWGYNGDGETSGVAGLTHVAAIASHGRVALVPMAPTLGFGSADAFTTTEATLRGRINANGQMTSARFEFGTDTSYSGGIIPVGLTPDHDVVMQNVEVNIAGLSPNTTYHYRLIATNPAGTTTSGDATFHTPSIPFLTTTPASDITETTALSGGEVTDDGDRAVTERGIVWSTTPNPDLDNGTIVIAGTGIGIFDVPMGPLLAGTTYHVRAYATNIIGTGYGEDVYFTTHTTITLVDGLASYSREILPGDEHVFLFTLFGPRFVSLSTLGGAALRAELFDGTGKLLASFDGDSDFNLDELLYAGDYELHISRQPDPGAAAQPFDLAVDASVVAFTRPDVTVGTSAAGSRGAGIFSPVRQRVVLVSEGARPVSGRATVANTGNLPDQMLLKGTRRNRDFNVIYREGRENITAGLVGGRFRTEALDEDSPPLTIRTRIVPNRNRLTRRTFESGWSRYGADRDDVRFYRISSVVRRKTFNVLIEVQSTFDPVMIDVGEIEVRTR